jgi:hypothetical protein
MCRPENVTPDYTSPEPSSDRRTIRSKWPLRVIRTAPQLLRLAWLDLTHVRSQKTWQSTASNRRGNLLLVSPVYSLANGEGQTADRWTARERRRQPLA